MTHMIDILMVEDNPADVDLTRENLSLSKVRNRLHVVEDGLQQTARAQDRADVVGLLLVEQTRIWPDAKTLHPDAPGKAQGSFLRSRGKSRYGSRLRLQNAEKLKLETNEKLGSWLEADHPRRIVCSVETASQWVTGRSSSSASPTKSEPNLVATDRPSEKQLGFIHVLKRKKGLDDDEFMKLRHGNDPRSAWLELQGDDDDDFHHHVHGARTPSAMHHDPRRWSERCLPHESRSRCSRRTAPCRQ